jgi:hypothetical protein
MNHFNLKTFIPFVLLSFLVSCVSHQSSTENRCLKNIIAFDFGSTSTKAAGALVDTCKDPKLNLVIQQINIDPEIENVRIPFKQHYDEFKDFKSGFLDEALSKISDISKKLINSKNDSYDTLMVGVATSVFRKAESKGEEVVKKITSTSKIDTRVVSEQEEGQLAFYGAVNQIRHLPVELKLNLKDLHPEKIIVWDVGGGSQQITWLNNKSKLDVLSSRSASLSAKDRIMSVSTKTQFKKGSPNPLTHSFPCFSTKDFTRFEKCLENTLKTLNGSLNPSYSKAQMVDFKSKIWIGVGGVLFSNTKSLLKNEFSSRVTLRDFKKALFQFSKMTDSDLGNSAYVDTQVTNLVLIISNMIFFEIEELILLDTNLTHGIIATAR